MKDITGIFRFTRLQRCVESLSNYVLSHKLIESLKVYKLLDGHSKSSIPECLQQSVFIVLALMRPQ